MLPVLQVVLIIQADEKSAIIQKLSYAASLLPGKISGDLIPPGGVHLAYARKVARDDADIACVRGGLGLKDNVLSPDNIGFSGGGMIVTVLLTAMKFDPRVRSAALIACTSAAVKMMESRYFEICSFDPLKEPPGIKTMDWGVAQCCRDGVPDAVYNRRTGDTGAIIRLFGEDPLEVANNILMLSV
jgi:predicted fused transcriptional regulator/phosphomethylpyrimidine kinase